MSPLISTFGAASSFGYGAGGGAVESIVNVKFIGKWHATNGNIEGASIADYITAASYDHYTAGGTGNLLTTAAEFGRVGYGILTFQLPKGTYNFEGKAGDTGHSGGATSYVYTGTLTLTQDEDLMLLIGNHGNAYGAGGGTYLVKGTDYTNTSNTPIIIWGGGAAQVTSGNTENQPGAMSTSQGTSRGNVTSSWSYVDGGGFNQSSTSNSRAHLFTEGGLGYTPGGTNTGGFGGGGSYYGGAGGYLGGKGGTAATTTYWGGYVPGDNSGGGTSYYDTNYVSNLVATSNPTQIGSTVSTEYPNMNGFFGIYTV